MAKTYTQINIPTDTFAQWLSLTNDMALGFADVVTIAANTAGDNTTGNGYVTGTFGAQTLIGTNLRGGSVTTSGPLGVTSNLVMSGATINSTSNTYTVAANVYTVSAAFVVGSNSTVNSVTVFGNSTFSSVSLNGNNLSYTGNATFANVVTMDKNLTVSGNATVNGVVTIGTYTGLASNTATLSGTSAQLVDSFDGSTFRGSKYVLSMTDTANSTYQMTEILLLHDGGTAYTTEYATLRSVANNIANFSANVSGSTVRLYVVPAVASLTVNLTKILSKS